MKPSEQGRKSFGEFFGGLTLGAFIGFVGTATVLENCLYDGHSELGGHQCPEGSYMMYDGSCVESVCSDSACQLAPGRECSCRPDQEMVEWSHEFIVCKCVEEESDP